MKKQIKLALMLSMITCISLQSFINQDNTFVFIKGLFKDPDNVGAFFPCSRFVAREICTDIDHSKGPLRILEIGSGTGALTKTIVENLAHDDTLDLVELQPVYCDELKKLYGTHSSISIFCGSILDWKPDYQYDVIICSLPFNRFKPDFVTSLLHHITSLGKPNAMLSYVELMWVTQIKKAFLSGKKKKRLEKTLKIMKKFRKTYQVSTKSIYRNVTPIYVHHLRLTQNS